MSKNTGTSLSLPATLAALALVPVATAAQQSVAITNVTVISMADTAAAPARTVIIQDGRIAPIGSAGAVRVPAGARVVDGTGKYLIPGLFDMHVHTSKSRASALGLYVVHGVTTVRDQGSEHAEVLKWRREIRAGTRIGPHMLIAGPDVLLNHGLPVDYSSWDQPFIGRAIFEADAQLVEFLVTRGAKIDERARGSAEELFAQRPHEASRRRILELCGGRDPGIVVQEYQERRNTRVMQTAPDVEKAFDFAKLDAQHLGLKAVSPENLFVGLMREDGLPVYPVVHSGADLLKIRAALGERFEVTGAPPAEMTADEECRAVLMTARREAEHRKNPYYTTVHMFYALMRQPPQSVLDLIRAAGGNPHKIIEETETILAGMG